MRPPATRPKARWHNRPMQESTIKKYLPWVVATALLMLEVFGEHHLDRRW
jgi:hypothetical protein